jgi:hypothetical protein
LIKSDSLIFGLFVNKTIKAIGHVYLRDSSEKILLVTHADKKTSHVNVDKYQRLEVSREAFVGEAKKAAEESQGNVSADDIVNK